MSDNLLNIKVGSAGKAKTFQIERDFICYLSPFIRNILSNPWVTNEISLERYEPVAFELFSKWIHGHEIPEVYISIQDSEEPWLSYGVDICLLAMKLRCPDFEKEALVHFIQSCALAPFGPWAQIEREAPQETSLRRFSNHWVAWNFYLSGCGNNEYTSLEATSFVGLVTGETRDPRILDMEHWFSGCGDSLISGCSHDPVSRQEKLQQNAVRMRPLPGPKDLIEAQQERALQRAGSLHETVVSLAESKTKAHAPTTPRMTRASIIGLQTPKSYPLSAQPVLLQPGLQTKPSASVLPSKTASPPISPRSALSSTPVSSTRQALSKRSNFL